MASQYSGGKEYYIGDEYSAKIGNRVIKMFAYFPKDAKLGDTINTRIYWPGIGGYERNPGQYVPISDYYTDNDNVDYAVLAFGDCSEYNGYTQETIDQVINQIKTEKGIDLTINSVTGLSAGGNDLVSNTLNILRTDSSAEQQRMLLYDPYSADNGFWYNLSSDDLRLMRNNETEAVFFLPTNRGYTYRDSKTNEGKFVNALAANGIPVVLIDGNFDHGYSTANALYNGWMDFLDGYCDLEDISLINYDFWKGKKTIDLNYQVSVPSTDTEGNVTWITYKLADLIDAKLHPGNYSQQQLSEFNHAIDCLYDVVQVMDADTLKTRAQRLLNSFSMLLETSIPNCESTGSSVLIPGEKAAVAEIKSVMASVRDSLEKEINFLLYAENEYINMDAKLAANTRELNDMVSSNLTDLKMPYVPLEVEFEKPNTKEQIASMNYYASASNYTSKPEYSHQSIITEDNNHLSNEEKEVINQNDSKEVNEVSSNDVNSEETSVYENTIKIERLSNDDSTKTILPGNNNALENSQIENDSVVNNIEDQYLDTDVDTSSTDNISTTGTYTNSITGNAENEYVAMNTGNKTLKTVGILTAAGAATAAGAYATKKYIDKKRNEDVDDDEYERSNYNGESDDNDEI